MITINHLPPLQAHWAACICNIIINHYSLLLWNMNLIKLAAMSRRSDSAHAPIDSATEQPVETAAIADLQTTAHKAWSDTVASRFVACTDIRRCPLPLRVNPTAPGSASAVVCAIPLETCTYQYACVSMRDARTPQVFPAPVWDLWTPFYTEGVTWKIRSLANTHEHSFNL